MGVDKSQQHNKIKNHQVCTCLQASIPLLH